MTIPELVIIAFAVSLSAFPNAVFGSIESCQDYKGAFKIAVAFALSRAVMVAFGFWICSLFTGMISGSVIWLVFGLLFILGIKTLISSLYVNPSERTFRYNNTLILFLSAFALGIDGFIAGLAFGFVQNILLQQVVLYFFIFTFLITLIGISFGKKSGNIRWTKRIGVIGGVIVIIMSLEYLLRII